MSSIPQQKTIAVPDYENIFTIYADWDHKKDLIQKRQY